MHANPRALFSELLTTGQSKSVNTRDGMKVKHDDDILLECDIHYHMSLTEHLNPHCTKLPSCSYTNLKLYSSRKMKATYVSVKVLHGATLQ